MTQRKAAHVKAKSRRPRRKQGGHGAGTLEDLQRYLSFVAWEGSGALVAELVANLYRIPSRVAGSSFEDEVAMIHARAHFAQRLHTTLMSGQRPTVDALRGQTDWEFAIPKVVEWLEGYGVHHFTKDNAKLSDQMVASAVQSLTKASLETHSRSAMRGVDGEAQRRMREHEKMLRRKAQRAGGGAGGVGEDRGGWGRLKGLLGGAQVLGGAQGLGGGGPSLTEEERAAVMARFRAEGIDNLRASTASSQAVTAMIGDLDGEYREYLEAAGSLREVFGVLEDMMDVSWGLGPGLLRSHGFQEIVRLHQQIKNLQGLRELLKTVGRMSECDDRKDGEPSSVEKLFKEVTRKSEKEVQFVVDNLPEEAVGVIPGSDICRMIPAEMALLGGGEEMELMWHAKRIEGSLLTYHMQGHDSRMETVENKVTVEDEQKNFKEGPIIVCLDTSGSMQGLPETVAKAVVLEAVKTATREKRQLFLINFSGPGTTAALELAVTSEGLQNLIGLLTSSFSGGTDVDKPLSDAIEKIRESSDWNRADVLMVSDGGFSVPSSVVHRLQVARKEHGTRFHGVLIGNYATAMSQLCDPNCLHTFHSWEDLGKAKQARAG